MSDMPRRLYHPSEELNMKWSVLICCYNSIDRIQRTLESVIRQSAVANGTIEVIVIDNASTDGTREVVESFDFPATVETRILFEPRPGLSFARRTAIENARGTYLCFLDDDNDAASDYLQVAQEIFEANPNVSFCGGESFWPKTQHWTDLPLIARFFSKAVAVGPQRASTSGPIERGGFLWGAGLCIRADGAKALYSVGFSPVLSGRLGMQVLSGEDGELTILLQMTGCRGYYSPALRLDHRVNPDRLNLRYFSKLFYGMGMAAPVIRAYQQVVEDLVCARETDLSRIPRVSRTSRVLELSLRDACAVLALYTWLGACFSWGALRGRWSALPKAASDQAQTLFIKLNNHTSYARLS
jgi:glycosyltransferase involved in cell wall biosynthesis